MLGVLEILSSHEHRSDTIGFDTQSVRCIIFVASRIISDGIAVGHAKFGTTLRCDVVISRIPTPLEPRRG